MGVILAKRLPSLRNDNFMPEGPEVLIYARWLHDVAVDNRLIGVTPVSGRYYKNPELLRPLSELLSTPQLIRGVDVRGKFLYMEMLTHAIGFTLAMTGGFSVKMTPHSRLEFRLISLGGAIHTFYFVDARNFGTVKLYTQRELSAKIKRLGQCPLAIPFTSTEIAYFAKIPKLADLTLAAFLLRQTPISGIGNYLRSEILYRAGLFPFRRLRSLDDHEVRRLTFAINDVPRESVRAGGASLRNYLHPNGEPGKFARQFKVYGRKFTPSGSPVRRLKDPDTGRSIYYAEADQQAGDCHYPEE